MFYLNVYVYYLLIQLSTIFALDIHFGMVGILKIRCLCFNFQVCHERDCDMLVSLWNISSS